MEKHGQGTAVDYSARAKRRTAVKMMLSCMTKIREAEQDYLNNVPENFQNSALFQVGEDAVDTLEEIISLLDGVY